jgi:hypothetical protein
MRRRRTSKCAALKQRDTRPRANQKRHDEDLFWQARRGRQNSWNAKICRIMSLCRYVAKCSTDWAIKPRALKDLDQTLNNSGVFQKTNTVTLQKNDHAITQQPDLTLSLGAGDLGTGS